MTATNLFQIGSGWFPEHKGGAENMFFNIFHGLGAEGFSVHGLVPGSVSIQHQTGGRMRGFDVSGTSIARRAATIRRSARDSFQRNTPDLLASHFALYSLPLIGRMPDVPFVNHFYGPWAMESAAEGAGPISVQIKKLVERLVYRQADRVIVMSEAFARLLQQNYKVTDEAIRIVPGGVDCGQYDLDMSRAAARRKLGWDPDRPTVFVVRRLVRRMGLDRLLEAMATLRASDRFACRDTVLHIGGSGPERAALQTRAAALDLGNSVCFDGFIPDDRLALAYRAADVTLVPTAGLEGFGLVAVESLATGTPVLVTPVGGLPEVVSDLSPSMVLDGSGAADIAAGIAEFLEDHSFLPLPDACRDFARRNFDWPVVIPRIAAIYRELL